MKTVRLAQVSPVLESTRVGILSSGYSSQLRGTREIRVQFSGRRPRSENHGLSDPASQSLTGIRFAVEESSQMRSAK